MSSVCSVVRATPPANPRCYSLSPSVFFLFFPIIMGIQRQSLTIAVNTYEEMGSPFPHTTKYWDFKCDLFISIYSCSRFSVNNPL